MTQAERAEFSANGIEIACAESIGSPESSEILPWLDGLVAVSAKVGRESIDRLDRCRVIVRYGSGTDNIDVACATERGIVVANVPNFCLSEVADHTMALLLATARKLNVMDRHTRSGCWHARVQEQVHRVAGKTLGLIGFGKIAQNVARRAAPFGLRVIACDPLLDRERAAGLNVVEVHFEELLQQADFISMHAPLTAQTRHMIGEAQLRRMKPGSILINTSRGGLVDEEALVRALSEGWIAGAGIDVYESLPMFDPNPTFRAHPYFELENVVLTPHSAGTSVEALEELMLDGAREAIAVLHGLPPKNFVNPGVRPRTPFRSAHAQM